MTLRGDSTPSCAACRYGRRKCTATCPLAKYFPADKPELFHYVHRLYGVSSVTKILKTLETQDQKDIAMKSIIYESEMRHHYPAYGCSYIIMQLYSQLEAANQELRHIYAMIAARQNQSNQQGDHNPCYWPSSQQEFGGKRQRIDSRDVEGTESPEIVTGPVLGLKLSIDHNLLSSVHAILRERKIFFPDYGSLRYSTTAEDRQSCTENKEACGSSSKSSPTIDQLGE